MFIKLSAMNETTPCKHSIDMNERFSKNNSVVRYVTIFFKINMLWNNTSINYIKILITLFVRRNLEQEWKLMYT